MPYGDFKVEFALHKTCWNGIIKFRGVCNQQLPNLNGIYLFTYEFINSAPQDYDVRRDPAQKSWLKTLSLLGLMAKIKCSICSYQFNIWYAGH